jgi:hypothetical protein
MLQFFAKMGFKITTKLEINPSLLVHGLSGLRSDDPFWPAYLGIGLLQNKGPSCCYDLCRTRPEGRGGQLARLLV